MEYYNIPKENLIFMEDPFSLNNKNINFQIKVQHKILFILSKVPIVKRFIHQKYSKLLFESLVLHYLKKNKECIKDVYPQKDTIYTKVHHDLLKLLIQHNVVNLQILQKHFQIEYFDQNLISCDNDMRNKIDYQCNRISESLGINHTYNHSILSNEALWNSFYLSEIFVLLKYDFLVTKFIKSKAIINTTKKLDASLKGMWVSEYLEFESSKCGSLLEAMKMSFLKPDCINNEIIDSLLIKVFSMSPDYLKNDIIENELYIVLRELIFIAGILESNLLTGKNYLPIIDFVNCNLIRNSTLDLIVKILRKNTKNNNYKQYIKVEDDFFVRGGYSFKYGLRTLFKKIIRDRGRIGENFESDLGEPFEQYVINYSKKNLGERFKIFPGFKARHSAQVKGYDIDIVLFDKIFNDYYFIQAKFNVFSLPIFYSERCHFFQTGKFSNGYNKQLLLLK
jgi:hypothetical protein